MEGKHKKSSSASPEIGLLCAKGHPDVGKVWQHVLQEAERVAATEHRLVSLMEDVFLSRASFHEAISARLARKLAREDLTRGELFP